MIKTISIKSVIIVLTLFMFNTVKAQDSTKNNRTNFIISSSPKGGYFIGTNILTKECVLINAQDEKVKPKLISRDIFKYFCIWTSDSSFIYAENKKDRVLYYKYLVGNDTAKEIGEAKPELINVLEKARFIKAPDFVSPGKRLFLSFELNNSIGIVYPIENEIKYVYELKKIVGDDYLKSIAIDSKGTQVMMTILSHTDNTGKIVKLNLANDHLSKLEESPYIINESYVYFLNNDSAVVYFRYRSLTKNKIEIVWRSLYSNNEKILDTFENIVPSYVVDVPLRHIVLISGTDIAADIEVERAKNNILTGILNGLVDRFKVVAVKY